MLTPIIQGSLKVNCLTVLSGLSLRLRKGLEGVLSKLLEDSALSCSERERENLPRRGKRLHQGLEQGRQPQGKSEELQVTNVDRPKQMKPTV